MFEDGIQETGSMVIGCDGSHSWVREFLVGHEAAKDEITGQTFINYAAGGYLPEKAHLLRSYHAILKFGWHPTVPGGAMLAGAYCLCSMWSSIAVFRRIAESDVCSARYS